MYRAGLSLQIQPEVQSCIINLEVCNPEVWSHQSGGFHAVLWAEAPCARSDWSYGNLGTVCRSQLKKSNIGEGEGFSSPDGLSSVWLWLYRLRDAALLLALTPSDGGLAIWNWRWNSLVSSPIQALIKLSCERKNRRGCSLKSGATPTSYHSPCHLVPHRPTTLAVTAFPFTSRSYNRTSQPCPLVLIMSGLQKQGMAKDEPREIKQM